MATLAANHHGKGRVRVTKVCLALDSASPLTCLDVVDALVLGASPQYCKQFSQTEGNTFKVQIRVFDEHYS